MNLDDAIKHAEKVAEEKEKLANTYESFKDFGNPKSSITSGHKECLSCAEEHRQLAEWLKDYKRLLEREPCEDCISREAVKELFQEACEMKMYDFLGIDDFPSVTPTRKVGKWAKYSFPRVGEQHYQCTNCKNYINFGAYGDYYTKDFKYCPHCGAEMEGEK